jgi:hypothetical protein
MFTVLKSYFGNNMSTVCDIASNRDISVGSIETTDHEHLLLEKLMHSITITCSAMMCTKCLEKKIWETVKDHPTA